MKNKKKADGGISAKTLWKLKHALNKGITYGGMNAKEVQEFKKIPADQWKRVNHEYKNWLKHIRVFDTKVLIAFLLIFGGGFFYFSDWLKAISAIIVICSLAEIIKRDGHHEGYMEGYESGFDEGVNKSIGIDEEEAADIYQSAIEMEIDDRLISEWDEKEGKSK